MDLVWNGAPIGPTMPGAKRQAGAVRPEQAPLKILFANKFFFLNGGSEVVMFDEMELMRKHDTRRCRVFHARPS